MSDEGFKWRGYSWKFYLGAFFVIFSTLIGIVVKFLIFVNLDQPFWFWFYVIIYILTWPVLLIGVWWVGKEYADKIRRYVSYKFYQEEIKKGTKKAYILTKDQTKRLRDNARQKSDLVKSSARVFRSKVKERMKTPFMRK